ncbi:hypothetical protein F8388_012042 [Cannabis sativa]|uniref:Uncharacterized protein n=1 Tax=Cannabis sativa TaxID=3483 RepID=A0A7J6GFS5_CANSA|nr:hypothetical protein F8388_012042 [Cannabis sativa]
MASLARVKTNSGLGRTCSETSYRRENNLGNSEKARATVHGKEKFYGFKMKAVVPLKQNLDDLNRIVLSLTNMGETIKEEDQVVIILNALPDQFKEMTTVIMYNRGTLTFEDVMSTLRSRDAELIWKKGEHKIEIKTKGNKEMKSLWQDRNYWELRDKKKQNKDEEDKGNDSNAVVDDHYSSYGDFVSKREFIRVSEKIIEEPKLETPGVMYAHSMKSSSYMYEHTCPRKNITNV